MSTNTCGIGHIDLIGDAEDNFYNMGVRDKNSYRKTMEHLQLITQSSSKAANKIVNSGLSVIALRVINKNPEYSRWLEAYSDGLGISLEDMAGVYLLPEIMSSIEKWIPGLNLPIFGCSSLFGLDSNSNPIHGRIFDYALVGTYDQFERTVHYKLKGGPSIWSASSSGIFLPSLTCMNEHGITLAVHQKANRFFDWNGSPLFKIVYNLMRSCENKADVIKYLKKVHSMTSWCLNLSFADSNDIMSVDITGKKIAKIETELVPGKFSYFNNAPIENSKHHTSCQPFTHHEYCQMRAASMNEKSAPYQGLPVSAEDVLKMLALPKAIKAESAKEWNLDTVTASSVQIATMNAADGHALLVPGSAPKYLKGEAVSQNGIWSKMSCETINIPVDKVDENYMLGMSEYSKAMAFNDKKNKRFSYHHIQMAEEYLHHYPEKWVAQFFFHVFQYIDTKDRRDYEILLNKFNTVSKNLPPGLDEQAKLFIFRIETILHGKSKMSASEFKIPALKGLYEFEKMLKPFMLKLLKKMINPRLDALDVLYTYYKGDFK
ncbi:MAG: hypothetical protein HOE90_15830 [Bacteriovoracaceae bacterium]|jgi:hypothetical protein|nr:hypothetical protein [Bacteriovoracaceae bacterium]